jgi:hypothetical protein
MENPELPADDPDKGFEPWSEERTLAKARQPGGIGWMERFGVISVESAADLRNRICGMCGRVLSQEHDPLSLDCAGHCWGCVAYEELDFPPSRRKVRKEIRAGLRFADGSPKPPPGSPGIA